MSELERRVSHLPDCDLCADAGVIRAARIHGRLAYGKGRWANMCDDDYGRYGIGLGKGLGQRLVVDTQPGTSLHIGPVPADFTVRLSKYRSG